MKKWFSFLLMSWMICSPDLQSQDFDFTLMPAALPNLWLGSVKFADMDRDGDLDIGVTGRDSTGTALTRVYRNMGDSTFLMLPQVFAGADYASLSWSDYNKDGFPDLLICGTVEYAAFAGLYSNNGDGTFSLIDAGLSGVSRGESSWADVNRDGNMDVVITGQDDWNNPSTRLYINRGDSTFDVYTGIAALQHSTVDWADLNLDGYPDLLINGHATTSGSPSAYVYINRKDETFQALTAGLQGAAYGAARWIDLDNDAYPDVIISGSYSGLIVKVYRNNGDQTFTEKTSTGLAGLYHAQLLTCDLNNDGWQDVLLAGYNGPFTRLYQNNGNFTFTEISDPFINAGYPALAAGDINMDGKTDLVISGNIATGDLSSNAKTRVYLNNTVNQNLPPTIPSALRARTVYHGLELGWSPATDAGSDTMALTYNLYIGSEPGKDNVLPSLSRTEDGSRLINLPGNAGADTVFQIDIPPGTYYWSVQAIDGNGRASAFADEEVWTIFENPSANAGADRVVCQGGKVMILPSEAAITNADRCYWAGAYVQAGNPLTLYTDIRLSPMAPDEVDSLIVVLVAQATYYGLEDADTMVIRFSDYKIPISMQPVDLSVCAGVDTALEVKAEGEDLVYQWWTRDNSESPFTIAGEFESRRILENVQSYYVHGEWRCKVIDTTGCYAFTDTIQVKVHEYPQSLAISEESNTLLTDQYPYIQWMSSTGDIPGANASPFRPEESGDYYVRAGEDQACTITSAVYHFIHNETPVSRDEKMHCWPNPVSDFLNLDLGKNPGMPEELKIINTEGVIVRHLFISDQISQVDVSGLAPGTYWILRTNSSLQVQLISFTRAE
ncbi:MAG: FG-GAP-like repeat-containing protein [Bacteroidales bacterium]